MVLIVNSKPRSAGGFDGVIVNNRPVIPVPFGHKLGYSCWSVLLIPGDDGPECKQ